MTLNEFDPRHPHEPELAPIIDHEGRCLVCSRLWLTEENERLARQLLETRTAIDAALHELGVPGEGYPAPVANAVDILRAALAEHTETPG